MTGDDALNVLARALTSDSFSRNVADMRTDLPDTEKISIIVSLGDIRAARRALGIPPQRRDMNQ